MTNPAKMKTLLCDVHQTLDRRNEEQKWKIENLLVAVRPILDLQEKSARLSGEKFNVFSILKIDEREKTHSDFIGELLNPQGLHWKGDVFLKLFLCAVGNQKLDAASAHVEIEKHIQTVGRIDIYIEDEHKNSVIIENKIHAEDQNAQIQRYCEYNKLNNTVYYLTLSGDDPSEESRGKCEAGLDYWPISYKEDIIPWLELCLKEGAAQPVLRETIRQYILLLRRLTSTMNDAHEKHLHCLMLQYYDEARYISKNFQQAIQTICNEVRERVLESLKEKLANDRYTIEKGDNNFCQIWLRLKGYEERKLRFGVEPFTTNCSTKLFVGVQDDGGTKEGKGSGYTTALGRNKNPWWPERCFFDSLEEYKDYAIDMADKKTLLKLYEDENFKKKFIQHIVDQTQEYLDEQTEPLLNFLRNSK